ncbi:MAG: hypothetical protein LBQ57_13385, partial [Spirochaetales bacterium]|nr:hypothetical protein [Spirochaetales bacterium]
SLPGRKSRPEKLQSNFVSVFAQYGRSRPFNPIAPHGLQKMVSFWNWLSCFFSYSAFSAPSAVKFFRGFCSNFPEKKFDKQKIR